MTRRRSVRSAVFSFAHFLPVYETTAIPSELSPEVLDEHYQQRYPIIQIRLQSVNYQTCRAFHKVYLETWWELLGQSLANVEVCYESHVPGTQGDLLLTYKLHNPIHLQTISIKETFKFVAEGERYCQRHNVSGGRLVLDPEDATGAREWRANYCCGRVETQIFRATLSGRHNL